MRDPRRAYRVVDAFEDELADYCGSPYAVTVDSCTNALYAALCHEREHGGRFMCHLPRRTYVGVLQAALNAQYRVEWRSEPDYWQSRGSYHLYPTRVWDCARCLPTSGGYSYESGSLTTLSFHSAKQLPLGRGGAILTDDHNAVEWLQRFRADGRAPGDGGTYATFPAAHCYMPPDTAARGLWILSRWNDSGYEPAPLISEQYPDLSALMAQEAVR